MTDLTRFTRFCRYDYGWWFRIRGYGLAFKRTRHGHVLFSTRWRKRPALHLGPVNPDYPGDGRVCPEGKPVRRWVMEVLTP
jgi:hypothetical protein